MATHGHEAEQLKKIERSIADLERRRRAIRDRRQADEARVQSAAYRTTIARAAFSWWKQQTLELLAATPAKFRDEAMVQMVRGLDPEREAGRFAAWLGGATLLMDMEVK